MPWTEDQQRAIEARGKNLLVAAAAGSGKTSVLVERVMRLVDEGVNIDEILVVTFTRAASSDMREKLTRRFMERANAGDQRAREQMERIEGAAISTLHSFCIDVLRANFETAGVDPMFRILDDAEFGQLTDRAMDEALEEAYVNGGEDIEALDFARGPKKVRELVMGMHAFLMERPDPDAWFQNALSLIGGDGEIWKKTLADAAKIHIKEAYALNDYGIQRALTPLGPLHYADAMREDAEVMRALFSLSYDELSEAVPGFKQITPKRVSRKKDDENQADIQALTDEVIGIRKNAKSAMEKAAKLLSLNSEESMEDIRRDKRLIEIIFTIAKDMEKRLQTMKDEKTALTFSDLEHKALKALSDSGVAKGVKSKYKYIFIDEYQDTSDVQEAIISKIAGDRNLFMVGDVKQSIYRFREAEPRLFLEKFEEYKLGGDNERVVLKKNFRSRPSILEFVNFIFSRVMHGDASEIVYDDDQKLYPGAEFEGEDPVVELHIIDKKGECGEMEETEGAEAAEEEEELTDAYREGILIAGRIKRLMKEDPSIRLRDICILTRVRVNSLMFLAAALADEGIDAYADASESYFDALEVKHLMSALRLIVNRRRDVDLISVMRSPMFSFTTKELALIRATTNTASFYDALSELAESNPKIYGFLNALDTWRTLSRSMPISSLIRRIAADTGFYASVGALAGGRQRQANIDQLCNRAVSYEASVGGSLSQFLEYALLMRAKGDGDGAHILSENDDVVRLMTAHKSKGLEFPIVFASLLGRRFHVSRAEDQLLANRDLGAALLHADDALETLRDTISRRAIAVKTHTEDRAEELRILYVTLTRAKSRLILTGTVSDVSKSMVKWSIAGANPDIYSSALDIAAAAALGCPGSEALGGKPMMNAPTVKTFVHAGKSIVRGSHDDTAASQRANEILKGAIDGECYDSRMDQALLWVYPNRDNVYAPVKLTASGLAREAVGAFEIPDINQRPAFLSENGLTPMERGSAIHAYLRALDYDDVRKTEEEKLLSELFRQRDKMLLDGKLLKAEANAVRLTAVQAFLLSPIGKRILASDAVHREWRFNLRMKAEDAMPGEARKAEVIVQGSIDLCFMEKGEWVLVDYKTDRSADQEELKARYLPQLRLYKAALERITGIRVKETVIQLVAQGDSIKLDV
ncbi:MAG: UvrD-helicase domain-containing protein [Clostridia bacterium]|nr:UvrD-helicase domain-containing protein [Clostridia bacterium]